jgi:hypothetical protein
MCHLKQLSSWIWQEIESNCFLHTLHRNQTIFFVLKNTLKLYNFHMYYMLKKYKRYTLEKPIEFYFHLTHVVQCFLRIFHIISMQFSCGNNMNPFINIICIKQTQTLPFYQVRDDSIYVNIVVSAWTQIHPYRRPLAHAYTPFPLSTWTPTHPQGHRPVHANTNVST